MRDFIERDKRLKMKKEEIDPWFQEVLRRWCKRSSDSSNHDGIVDRGNRSLSKNLGSC